MPEIVLQVNHRAASTPLEESYTIPAGSGIYEVLLNERPEETTPSSVDVTSGGTTYTEVFVEPLTATEYCVDYYAGTVSFQKAASPRIVTIGYGGLGTIASAVWANHVASFLGKSVFLAGVPSARPDSGDVPNAIIFFPPLGDGITIKRIALSAQTILGLSGDTVVQVCNMEDPTDEDAESISATLTDTAAAENSYFVQATGTITLDFATSSQLYVRVVSSGGHANITVEVFAA